MTISRPSYLQENIPLATLTTLEVGGPARFFAEPNGIEEIKELILWCEQENIHFYPLGGGSNVLAADTAYPGLVMRPRNSTIELINERSDTATLRVEAGMVWDDFVRYTVDHNWAGVECLSGIPGRVGASPMQNIGAYGQEAAQAIAAVEVLDAHSGEASIISAQDCAFAYRTSRFKTAWRGKYIITAVHFRLTPHGPAHLRYRDLQEYFSKTTAAPSLAEVRQAVLTIRQRKSMLHDLNDPNHRSAGSFFLNPIVDQEVAAKLQNQHPQLPIYEARPGYSKLSAAWLIANAGFSKGFSKGRAKLSDKHVLCLVNAGGATAQELLELAHTIQFKVHETFAIDLVAEPNMLGFNPD